MTEIGKALPLIGLFVGLAALGFGTWAIRFVWRSTRRVMREDGTRIRIATILLGITFAAGVSAIKYYPDARTMIYGFPFASFVFEQRNGHWLDFVGPFTIPALAGNAIAGFLLPFVATALLLRKRQAS